MLKQVHDHITNELTQGEGGIGAPQSQVHQGLCLW